MGRQPATPDPVWFATGEPELPGTAPRIFCFPHAGGGPAVFTGWQPALAGAAEVVALCPPGKAWRGGEPAFRDIGLLADRAAEAVGRALDRPTILFGHSLGAVLAFEVARRLSGSPHLRHLVASGCAAPRLMPTQRVIDVSRLEGREFAEAVRFFGGLPPDAVADEDLRALLLPGLRDDFRLAAGYRYTTGPALPIEITLINGRDDPHVRPELLDGWSEESERPVRAGRVDGDHFYFQENSTAVTDLLAGLARGCVRHVELI